MNVYLDNNATTAVDPLVLETMLPYFCEKFGNAASRSHRWGHEAEAAVELSRQQVATALGAEPKDIVFTSGATESDNIAIKGVAAMYADQGKHIITQATEHKAVIDPAKYLEHHGFRITILPVNEYGMVDVAQLAAALKDDTILVSIMHGNNEIGTLQPIAEIGQLCKARGVLFHTDATQSFGKVPLDVNEMGIDLLSLSAHKIHGPKGVGALYVRRKRPRVRCEPVIHGGGHERGMRSGTLNVPGIVGLGKAAELATQNLEAHATHLRTLRDHLEKGITSQLDQVTVNGHPTERTPQTLNVSFAYVEGESLMMGIEGIAVSSGSACTSASLEPSHVLKAMGVGDDVAHSSIRFSVGRFNTAEEIDYTIERVVHAVRRLREMSPLYEMAQSGVDPKNVQWDAH